MNDENKNETALVVAEKNLPAKPKRADKKILRQESIAYARLRDEALDALKEYRRCQNIFDFVCDEKLIDVSIYDIQKAMSRFEFLVGELKHTKRSKQ